MPCLYCKSTRHLVAVTREELLECRDTLYGEPNPQSVKIASIQQILSRVIVHTDPIRYVEAINEIVVLLKED